MIQKQGSSVGIVPLRVLNTKYYIQFKKGYFICNLCNNILVNPYNCEICNHSFCYDCIHDRTCPLKCENFSIRPSSKAVDNNISKLMFRCLNKWCKEKITYSKVIDHDKKCIYQIIKCPYPICFKRIILKNYDLHKKNDCKYNFYKCLNCMEFIPKHIFKKHEFSCVKNRFIFDQKNENIKENNKKIQLSKYYTNIINSYTIFLLKSNEEKYFRFLCENLKLKKVIKKSCDILLNSKNENKKKKMNLINLKTDFEDLLAINLNKYIISLNNISFEIENSDKIFHRKFENTELFLAKVYNSSMFLEINGNISNLFDGLKLKIIDEISISFSENYAQIKEINIETKFNEDMVNFMSKQITKNNLLTSLIKECNLKELLKTQRINNQNDNIICNVIDKFDHVPILKIIDLEYFFSKLLYLNNNYTLHNKYDNLLNDLISDFPLKDNDEILSDLKNKFIEINTKLTIKTIELEENLSSITKHLLEKIYNNGLRYSPINTENIVNFRQIFILSKSLQSKYDYTILKILQEFIKTQFSPILNDLETISMIYDTNNYIFSFLLEKSIETNYVFVIRFYEVNLKITQIKEIFNDTINSMDNFQISEDDKLNYNNREKFILENISDCVNNIFNNKLEIMENSIEKGIYRNLSEMNELKWCKQCSNLEYFFSFIKCNICCEEKCKNCITLCQSCNKFSCYECTVCPKCSNIFCFNCRESCLICDNKNINKFCQICVVKCDSCKKGACLKCRRLCISCNNETCKFCSIVCFLCKKCSCNKCEFKNKFNYCIYCKLFSCKDCNLYCISCKNEVCKSCSVSCRYCKKLVCKKCCFICEICLIEFCYQCYNLQKKIKCNLCQKKACNNCCFKFKNCTKCKLKYCFNCSAICKICKTINCNNCNINCDNCNSYSCPNCIYRCNCEKIDFCDKCLFGQQSIGPHDCLCFINHSSIFSSLKTRSNIALPTNFEAKLYLGKIESRSLLIGITDNKDFIENSLIFIDNIWTIKVRSWEKYSTKFGLQPYLLYTTPKDGDSIFIILKNNHLFLRLNYYQSELAFTIESDKNYYLYLENETPNLSCIVNLVYIRKI